MMDWEKSKDGLRREYYLCLLSSLAALYEETAEAMDKKTLNAAFEYDRVRGYQHNAHNRQTATREALPKLRAMDKTAWAHLLYMVEDDDFFYDFKEKSPFKDSIILFVVSERRHVLRGTGRDLADRLIKKIEENGLCLGEHDVYLVCLPSLEIVWTTNNFSAGEAYETGENAKREELLKKK